MSIPRRILIATGDDDLDAPIVKNALLSKGHEVSVLLAEKCPTESTYAFSVGDGGWTARLNQPGGVIDLTHHDSVWWRRFGGFVPPREVHPDDQRIVFAENSYFSDRLCDLIAPSAFWVNRHDADMAATNKTLQLQVAESLGLKIPRTLVTNDRKEAVDFINNATANGQCVLHKSNLPHNWDTPDSGKKPRIGEAALISTKRLVPERMFRVVPSIMQVVCAKILEVRVAFMGSSYCAISYNDKPDVTCDRIDSRSHMQRFDMARRHYLPDPIVEQCKAMMKELGLVFGCFDLLIDEQNDYVFLEVNSTGQWLWMEYACREIAMLDAFCDFIAHGETNNSAFTRTSRSLTVSQAKAWSQPWTDTHEGTANPCHHWVVHSLSRTCTS